jgi:hypothetical protein
MIISIGGVAFAAYYSKDPGDGGRGGAIAVIISFAALFGTRNYAADVYEALTSRSISRRARILRFKEKLPAGLNNTAASASPDIPVEVKIRGLEARLSLDAKGQVNQNIWLALSTTIGTGFWGFGDILARWLILLTTPRC